MRHCERIFTNQNPRGNLKSPSLAEVARGWVFLSLRALHFIKNARRGNPRYNKKTKSSP
ncbi:hypothetical protein [Helicobacter sp. T3_23-1056]